MNSMGVAVDSLVDLYFAMGIAYIVVMLCDRKRREHPDNKRRWQELLDIARPYEQVRPLIALLMAIVAINVLALCVVVWPVFALRNIAKLVKNGNSR